jgi:hypothetical protein
MIAALFVQPDGCYANEPCIDAWPESRDARKYAGPNPVIAHPPCQLWGAMAAVNFARWGGEHNRPGNDGGCFASALASVNRWGGVLEHPAKSRAWAAHGLTKPTGMAGAAQVTAGSARSGNQLTGIEPIKRHGFIIEAIYRRLICGGIGQPERIKSDSMISEERRRISRRLAGEKLMLPHKNSAMCCSG